MGFTLAHDVQAIRRKIRDFIAAEVLPVESDASAWGEGENITPARLEGLRAKARAAGLWAPQMPKARGGLGLNTVGMAACYEEAARSLFGPLVLNCSAPDDGNMMVLNKIGTEAQKGRWLQPIIDGKARSSIVMTEPMPGSGSDPSVML